MSEQPRSPLAQHDPQRSDAGAASPEQVLSDSAWSLLRSPELPGAFQNAQPFPHVAVDDFLRPEIAAAMAEEFDPDSPAWTFLHHINERKRILPDVTAMGPTTRLVVDALQSERFLGALRELSGLAELIGDPDLDGGGLADMREGSFLNVHRDFLSHGKRRSWQREINLIFFFTPQWRAEWGGALELWDHSARNCVRRVAPEFNRVVIFRTIEGSYHGVPDPLTCPPGERRRTLALYYFRDLGRTRSLQPTHYVPRPSDGRLQRVLIAADLAALRVYSLLKRYTPLRDGWASRLLRFFS